MRIIVKPLGYMVMAGVVGVSIYPFTKGSTVRQVSPRTNILVSDHWKFYTESKAVGQIEAIQASPKGVMLPGIKITTQKTGVKPWNIGVSNSLNTAFRGGESLSLSFWARSKKESTLGIVVQRKTAGFPECFHKTAVVGKQWKQYRYKVTTFPMTNFESMVGLHFGYKATTMEVVGVQLER